MTEQKCFVFRFADVEVREREFRVIRAGDGPPRGAEGIPRPALPSPQPQQAYPQGRTPRRNLGHHRRHREFPDACVALLRRVLEDDTHEPHFIATVATVGYRFVCPVEVVEESSGKPDPKTQPIANDDGRGANHAGEPDCCSSRLCEDQSARETWVVADPWISQRRSWTRRWIRVYLLFDATGTRAKSFQLRPTHA